MIVRDFEVAGIQMKGADKLIIRRITVGPSGQPMVMGTFASARFIGLWFMGVYRAYWTPDERDVLLKNNSISYADRPGQRFSLWDVFKTLFLTEQIYARSLGNVTATISARSPPPAPEDEYDRLFWEAEEIFSDPSKAALKDKFISLGDTAFRNRLRRPDGGTLYGINVHRRLARVHAENEG